MTTVSEMMDWLEPMAMPDDPDALVTPDMVRASTAISLSRIADLLQRLEEAIPEITRDFMDRFHAAVKDAAFIQRPGA